MKFREYIKDKTFALIISFFGMLLYILILLAFKIPSYLIFFFLFLFIIIVTVVILIEFFRKRQFYNELFKNIHRLDKSYLVLETISKPNFYEGKLLFQALYDINKSMLENVKELEFQVIDFKNFIEMWIHEIKIPIASLTLKTHNQPTKYDKNFLEQLRRIEEYVELVLYYVRSEDASNDYLINKVDLAKVISGVLLKHKTDILDNSINLEIASITTSVYTDSKWLEFILSQIINNSIKYRDEKKNSYIKISVHENSEEVNLIIEDNGIGIPTSDINKVFDKSFTGYNGRIRSKSTGMGLFIAKNLCTKLGHFIKIESVYHKKTIVTITFLKNNFFEVIK